MCQLIYSHSMVELDICHTEPAFVVTDARSGLAKGESMSFHVKIVMLVCVCVCVKSISREAR